MADVPGLVLRGARQHNLKSIDLDLPHGELVVITGPSGSGKSSLAIHTIFSEGQRRFVESLSAYARKFLDRRPKAPLDSLSGIAPSICVQPRTPSRNPRSTVGTATETFDYLRLLFARLAEPRCPGCGSTVRGHTVQEVVDETWEIGEGARFSVLAPLAHGGGQVPSELIDRMRGEGFVRLRVDGEVVDIDDYAARRHRRAGAIAVVVDRLSVRDGASGRTAEAVELARRISESVVIIAPAEGADRTFSEAPQCVPCDQRVDVATPALFSFNSHTGACPRCQGLGVEHVFEAALVIPDETRSVAEGAVVAWGTARGAFYRECLKELKAETGLDVACPVEDLKPAMRLRLLEGGEGYEGVLPALERRLTDYARRRAGKGDEERVFEYLEEELGKYAERRSCRGCGGARLNPSACAYHLAARRIDEVLSLDVAQLRTWVRQIPLDSAMARAAGPVVEDLQRRLRFLEEVGLGYLSLSRSMATLSPGEAARVQLATQIGAGLSGVIYVLDEPSAGLHARDIERLIDTLMSLRDRGNTVIVVEHDPAVIQRADYLVEMGPGAGERGGEVVAAGRTKVVLSDEACLTAAYIAGRRRIAVPEARRAGHGELALLGARTHNLQGDALRVPLRALVGVTGVSGSGKSALVMDSLLPALRAALSGGALPDGLVLQGGADVDRVIAISQRPIGRSPRSNPATFCGFFKHVRELFAGLPEARARGYRPGRFSFNVKGGRCESCQGAGVVRVPMHFLPDAFVECESCRGRRYGRDTLQIRYRGRDIAEILAMSVDEATDVLAAVPAIARCLDALRAVGLGYLELGRPANQLSGGEAQRVKLARELSRRTGERTLYLMDEPTTGLHLSDVDRLIGVLQRLVDQGQSVLVIEHHLELIKQCDYLIDLGPGGGPDGGRIVVEGTPEAVAASPVSVTGTHLKVTLYG